MGPQRLRFALACLLLSSGCKAQDTEALGRIGKKLLEKSQSLVALARTNLAPGLPVGAGLAPLEERVGCRLRWDQTLTEQKIEIKADGKVIELRGTVNDLGQRRRAVELAVSTTGVEKVSDLMEVGKKE